jgi:HlyD family secretion protein
MKRLVTIFVILALAAAGGYYYYARGDSGEKAQVTQAAVSQGTILEQVQATGTLEAQRTVTVGPQVSGTIVSLEGVDYNSIVHKGQVVAKLDPSLLQVQVDIQEANIERQQTDIDSQKVQLLNDQQTEKRMTELHDKGLVNQTDWEQAVLNVKTRQAQIDSLQKQLVQAQANLSQAKLNVSYTEVKSPIDGVVVSRQVDVGQTVQSSMNVTPFFTIATDLRALKLTAGVDESDIGKIQRGADVTFTVDSYPDQIFHGTVNSVRLNAQIQSNVVTYPVWIDAPNPELKLRPSMTANVYILVSRAPNAVRLPNQALRFKPTTDMYTALGLTPPPTGRGRAGGRGANAANGANGAAAGAADQGQQAANGNGGRRRRNGGNGEAFNGGGGFGGGRGNFANMTPEEREAMRQQFAARGGRGAGAGAANGAAGANGPGVTTEGVNPALFAKDLTADKIDALYEPPPHRVQTGQVYKWDAQANKLTAIPVRYGINDAQYTELVSGDIKPGDQLVTGVIVPQTSEERTQSLFGPNGRGNFGGMRPGGPGGGGGGRGGFRR